MTARLVLANILSFGMQVSVIVAAAALLARALRLDDPRASLAYWRMLLLACLLLPVLQPWNVVLSPALTASTMTPLRRTRSRIAMFEHAFWA